MAAIEAHQKSAHMAEAMKQGGDNLEEPPKITILSPVGGFQRP